MRLEQDAVSPLGNQIIFPVPHQKIAGNNIFRRIERLIVPPAVKQRFRPLAVRITAEEGAILPDILPVFPFFFPAHGSVDVDGGEFGLRKKVSILLFKNAVILQQTHDPCSPILF